VPQVGFEEVRGSDTVRRAGFPTAAFLDSFQFADDTRAIGFYSYQHWRFPSISPFSEENAIRERPG
jgi:hypothetical protein